jgi:hypothetical protein
MSFCFNLHIKTHPGATNLNHSFLDIYDKCIGFKMSIFRISSTVSPLTLQKKVLVAQQDSLSRLMRPELSRYLDKNWNVNSG